MTHYHVHASADGPDYASDLFAALESADFWIDQSADGERQSADGYAESEDYQEAWEALKRSEALDNLHLNIRSVCDQWSRYKPRAPLYSGDDGDSLLTESALRIADRVNSETNVGISECSGECVSLRTVIIALDQDLAFIRNGHALTVNVTRSNQAGLYHFDPVGMFTLETPESDLHESIVAYLNESEI